MKKRLAIGFSCLFLAVAMLPITAYAVDIDITVDDAADFIRQGIGLLRIVIILIGAGFGIWGVVGLFEAYGANDGAGKSNGVKQLMAGIGLVLVGIMMPQMFEMLIPL